MVMNDWLTIIGPATKLSTHYSFHINRTNHSWCVANEMFEQKWTNFFKQNWSEMSSDKKHDKRNIAITFCSCWLSRSYFIMQTILLWLILPKLSIFRQTCTFFALNILGSTWETNIVNFGGGCFRAGHIVLAMIIRYIWDHKTCLNSTKCHFVNGTSLAPAKLIDVWSYHRFPNDLGN